MPSKNSINRPKLTVNVNRKNQSLARKRNAREKAGLLKPARSSENSKSGEVKSVPLDLYFQQKNDDGTKTSSGLTTRTLSKKRAKKIERNIKYAEQRKLLTDVQANMENEDGMEIDILSKEKKSKDVKKSALKNLKDAIWNILDDTSSPGLVLANGQGTTLGGPFFP
ncbi:hypothetical protein HG535_0H00650 [Zygotorulaspora mrakii]|uniref:Ribosome biogenesis protein ALB1 n=1 Tax=Zygotorulaspora mrakii TaxID=42260 RepID=A0A7H9B8H9_ZYGMR|nr:uncharacterized protein HG535_0H00650 [Zygotorulaspora mrakii]QLG74740.1 hypothetical protein HG535_0H00650 [Zygotorulaspora mrakii]